MSSPLVSIVVAAYNEERFVGEALASAHAQEYEPFEVVFVDDGSTDATARIAQSFPCRYVRQTNQGPAAARNAGIAAGNGELVAFLDADDVLPSDKLATQAAYLQSHPGTGCVLGRTRWIVEHGIDAPLAPDPVYGEPGGVQLVTAMLRRSVLERVGGFDRSYRFAEDRDLFVRLRENHVVIEVLDDCVLYKRLHGANATSSPPASHPLLRSLREKLERERNAAGAGS